MSSESVVVSRSSIKDESDVHVLGFSFWSSSEVPFVERCTIKECSSVIPCQAQ